MLFNVLACTLFFIGSYCIFRLTIFNRYKIYTARMSRGSSSYRSISAARARPQQQTRRPPQLPCVDCLVDIGHSTVFTALCYASAVLAMGLCPSVCVCLSVSITSRCSTKTAKRRITQTTPHDTPGLSFSDAKDLREIRPGSPPTRAPNEGGVGQNRRLSTNIRLYLENGNR